MDPASLSTFAIAILGPYVSKGVEEFTKAVGEVAYEKAKKLFGTLKTRWAGDPVASDQLARFEKKPEVHGPALEEVLAEKLAQDKDLAKDVEQTVKEIGPALKILVKMNEGEDVTGLKAREMRSGKADVTLDVGKGKNVKGAEFDTIG